MDEIIANAMGSRRADSGALECAKAMVLMRLVEPCSKKAVWESLASDVEVPGVDGVVLPLHTYYRTLEYLTAAKAEIEKSVHKRLMHLFNQEVSLVFYDLTSAYFEGTHCEKAKRGYSREHRPDLLQIEIGLLVDAEGLPIGHEVFDGNIKDVTTVLDALRRLKEDFAVRRCVFVGDDGMASEANLLEVEKQGYEYITSLPLRKSVIGQELVLAYPPLGEWKQVENNLWIHPLRADKGVRYIGSYNPERAASSRRHRIRRIKDCVSYLRKLQAGPKTRGRKRTAEEIFAAADRFIRRKGCHGLISFEQAADGGLQWELDRAAFRQERRMEGLLILKTNSRTLSDVEIASGYRTLWRVEDAFRHLKDGIRLRPIRHWSDPRVLGHVFICVLAYTLERLYERELEKAGLKVSARNALEELRSIITATISAGDRQLRRRSKITGRQEQLLSAVGLNEAPKIW